MHVCLAHRKQAINRKQLSLGVVIIAAIVTGYCSLPPGAPTSTSHKLPVAS